MNFKPARIAAVGAMTAALGLTALTGAAAAEQPIGTPPDKVVFDKGCKLQAWYGPKTVLGTYKWIDVQISRVNHSQQCAKPERVKVSIEQDGLVDWFDPSCRGGTGDGTQTVAEFYSHDGVHSFPRGKFPTPYVC